MLDTIRACNIAYADESTLQVLNEPNRKARDKSYMWCVAGGIKERFCYVYHCAASRGHEVIIELLENFSGFLHCDGYGGYDAYVDRMKKEHNLDITLVGCWYHCRRKFVEAAKVSKKPGLARWMVKKTEKLVAIEKEAKDNKLSPKEIYNLRLTKAKPILDEIKIWLDTNINKVLPKSLVGTAVTYAYNQWNKLTNYLLDGLLDNNNNMMERTMKPYATGRKNWMFCNSIEGANAAAVLLSFIEICKHHKIEPFNWFKYVLANIHNYNQDNLHELLPFNIDSSKLSA